MTRTRLLLYPIAVALIAAPSLLCQTGTSLEERDRLWVAVRDTMRASISQLGE